MKFGLLISRRYLFSKKSHNAINIVSMIAVVGVTVSTMAMVVVLSVFNGFRGLVADLFTGFDPELRITPRQGTVIDLDSSEMKALAASSDVAVLSPVVEGQALAVADEVQQVVMLKGVSDNFLSQSNIGNILRGDADPILHADVIEYCIPGILLCSRLQLPVNFLPPLLIYAPKPGERVNMANPQSGFNRGELQSSGLVFDVHQPKYDADYILCSIGFAQRLFGMQGRATAIEVRLAPGGSKKNIEHLLGDGFTVSDRYEQQEDVFRIMQVEKLISYAFLCFILLVACLNIMGSLTMLMIEKRQDMHTLSALGATRRQVRSVFVTEGMMIILGGALIGMAAALVLCLLQQHYGLVRMGQSEGSFIIDAYPVIVRAGDLLAVLLAVLVLGYASVAWTTRRLRREHPAGTNC